MKVQSTACATAKPITSQRLVVGPDADPASHAASRRMDSLWRAREVAGKDDAGDMASAYRVSAKSGISLASKKPAKMAQYGCRPRARMLSRAHDIRPYFQHPQLRHCCAYRPWQIDAGRPSDPDYRGLAGARDEGTSAGFHGYRARARHHHQGADGAADLSGQGRQDLHPQPDRHARPCPLRL